MDDRQIDALTKKCKLLRFRFMGVFAANNFPPIKNNSFQIVNASISSSIGTHWLLFCCKRNGQIIFADPLGLKMEVYSYIYRRSISLLYDNVTELLHASRPLQPIDSNACGLYCLYLAHEIFSRRYPKINYIEEVELHRFVKHMY